MDLLVILAIGLAFYHTRTPKQNTVAIVPLEDDSSVDEQWVDSQSVYDNDGSADDESKQTTTVDKLKDRLRELQLRANGGISNIDIHNQSNDIEFNSKPFKIEQQSYINSISNDNALLDMYTTWNEIQQHQ